MDGIDVFLALVPIVLLWWLIDWEIDYYHKHRDFMRYRSIKAKMPVYITMIAMAIGCLLVSLPFMVLTATKL